MSSPMGKLISIPFLLTYVDVSEVIFSGAPAVCKEGRGGRFYICAHCDDSATTHPYPPPPLSLLKINAPKESLDLES